MLGLLHTLTKLKRRLNQSIRIITSSSMQSNASVLLHSFNILPVIRLFQYNTVVLFHEMLHNNLMHPLVSRDLLQNKNLTRFAANKNFLLPTVHTNYGKKTSAFTAISLWNDLPTSIKSCVSLPVFKYDLRHHYLY